MRNELHEMCETLTRELEDANEKIRNSGGTLSGSDLDYVDKLTHALKSVKTTLAMVESEGESGMYPYYRNSYRGRYSSRGYSRDDDMISKLRELMNNAPDEKTRQEFKRFIDKIERM